MVFTDLNPTIDEGLMAVCLLLVLANGEENYFFFIFIAFLCQDDFHRGAEDYISGILRSIAWW